MVEPFSYISAMEVALGLTSSILKVIKAIYHRWKAFKELTRALEALESSTCRARLFIGDVETSLQDKSNYEKQQVVDQVDLLNKILTQAMEYIDINLHRSKPVLFVISTNILASIKLLGENIDTARVQIATSLTAYIADYHRTLNYEIKDIKEIVMRTAKDTAEMHHQIEEMKITLDQQVTANTQVLQGVDNVKDELRKINDILNVKLVLHCPIITRRELTIESQIGNSETVKLARYSNIPAVVKILGDGDISRDAQRAYECSMDCLVQIYGIVLQDPSDNESRNLVVMEKLEGDLAKLIEKLQQAPDDKKLEWSKKALMAKEIALGLSFLHSHETLHRQVSSANVLYTKEYHCKLTGYGVVKSTYKPTSIGPVPVGYPAYVAPELKGETRLYSFKSDVYAFGVVLWELCTGLLAGAGMKPEEIRQKNFEDLCHLPHGGVPSEFEDIIKHCCLKNAEDRYDLQKVIRKLESLITKYTQTEKAAEVHVSTAN